MWKYEAQRRQVKSSTSNMCTVRKSQNWGYLIQVGGGTMELVNPSVNVTAQDGRQLFQINHGIGNQTFINVCGLPCSINKMPVNAPTNINKYANISVVVGQVTEEYIFVERNIEEDQLQSTSLLHRYILGAKVGQGGFGSVYKVYDKKTHLTYALKKQPISNIYPRREIENLQQLKHPNIIHTHYIEASSNSLYFILEYMAGGDLSYYINPNGPHISERETKIIIQQVVEAVDYCHARGICHRDLKPENILLQQRELPTLVKITDFGIAKSEKQGYLTTGIGTQHYMAPEMLNGKYDEKVDVWSLGIILHLSLTGQFYSWSHPQPVSERLLKKQTAFSLLQGMLQIYPKKRFSITEVKNNKWLKNNLEEVEKHERKGYCIGQQLDEAAIHLDACQKISHRGSLNKFGISEVKEYHFSKIPGQSRDKEQRGHWDLKHIRAELEVNVKRVNKYPNIHFGVPKTVPMQSVEKKEREYQKHSASVTKKYMHKCKNDSRKSSDSDSSSDGSSDSD